MEPGTRNCTGVLLAFLLVPTTAAPQAPAECPTSECAAAGRASSPADSRIWREAASIRALKLDFVAALQRFTRAQAGTFADEGSDLLASVASMRASLERWDRAVAQFQADANRAASASAVHLAAATVLLDRHRIEDALRELRAAERDDAGRAEVYTLQALAFGALDKPADAARALRMAIAINPDNPTALYALAQQLTRLEQPVEATRALRDCQRALAKREATSKGTPPDAAPFERIDLLRQVAAGPNQPHALRAAAIDLIPPTQPAPYFFAAAFGLARQ